MFTRDENEIAALWSCLPPLVKAPIWGNDGFLLFSASSFVPVKIEPRKTPLRQQGITNRISLAQKMKLNLLCEKTCPTPLGLTGAEVIMSTQDASAINPPSPQKSNSRALDLTFVVLLFLFVLLRGLNLAAAQLPLNAWDEYQHLAAMEWLDSRGTMPEQTDTVPPTMWTWLRAETHPDLAAQQLSGIPGIRNYRGLVWDAQAAKFVPPPPASLLVPLSAYPAKIAPPLIYQAQQAPLFYQLMIRLKHFAGLRSRTSWLDAGRILNVCLAAGTAVLWCLLLLRLLADQPLRWLAYAVPYLLASTPLFMQDHARVANDGLAIFLGTAALWLYLAYLSQPNFRNRPRAHFWGIVGIGALTGLAVTAKTLAFILVPTFLIVLFVKAWQRREKMRWRLGIPAIFLVGYALTAGSFHYNAYRRYGSLSGTLSAKKAEKTGRGLRAMIAEIPTLTKRHGRRLIREALFYGFIDTGSWNELRQGRAKWAYKWFVLRGGLFCFILALLIPTARRRLGGLFAKTWSLGLAMLMMWSALFYYGLQTKVTLGLNCMLPWYGILTLPVFILLLLAGVSALSRRLGIGFTLGWAGIFAVAYYRGNFGRMLFNQTGLGFPEGLAVIRARHTLLALPVPQLLWVEGALLLLLSGLFVYRSWGEQVPVPAEAEKAVSESPQET